MQIRVKKIQCVGLGIKRLCPKTTYKKEEIKQRPLRGCPDNIFIGCGMAIEKINWGIGKAGPEYKSLTRHLNTYPVTEEPNQACPLGCLVFFWL